jgi:signal transduction histidine kinase
VAALGAVVYVVVDREVSYQIEERVENETALLKGEFQTTGLNQLEYDVRNRAAAPASLDYRLEDSSGRLLAGNLPPVEQAVNTAHGQWVRLPDPKDTSPSREPPEWEGALVTRLSDGSKLVVADDLAPARNAKHAVFVAFSWGLAGTMFLGAVGGLVLSNIFLRRIDAMTLTAKSIIAGNFTQRVPQTRGSDELARLASTFNQMLDRISSLIEANKQVSSDIAHDLKSPLGRVLHRLEAARARHDLTEYRKAVEGSIHDITSILHTFGALLRIGQIESGARRAGFRTVDLSAIALDVAEAFQPAAADERKTLTRDLLHSLPLLGDRELLTQLVANLVDNALRHTPEGSQIEIRTFKSGPSAQLIVSDNGPGVPAVRQKLIFERFYREERARTSPGDGLGLSLVAAIAELHGGTVVASDNRPGLRIIFEIPATQA